METNPSVFDVAATKAEAARRANLYRCSVQVVYCPMFGLRTYLKSTMRKHPFKHSDERILATVRPARASRRKVAK